MTVPGSGYIGGSYFGVFDINGALAGPNFEQPYDIVSATATFYFGDNADNYYHQYDGVFLNPPDQAGVQLGSSQQLGASSPYFSNVQQTGGYYYTCGGWPYYSQCFDPYYSGSYGYSGNFAATAALVPGALADLAADGILTFTVSPLAGDFYFTSAVLSFDVNQNPASVPEPATLALVGMGMVGAIAGARRRRNA